MDGWTITFSPGGFACQAKWHRADGTVKSCGELIPSGYVIAQHASYPDEPMCLSCMVATVRSFLRQQGRD